MPLLFIPGLQESRDRKASMSHHLAKKGLLGTVSSVLCSTIREGRIASFLLAAKL